MSSLVKFLKSGFILLAATILLATSCAVKKDTWSAKHSKASRVNASMLGRNKYYFSVGYQKKLTKSVKRR